MRNSCGCDNHRSDGGVKGGDTKAWSGDAKGGDGGDASADGGDGGTAGNVAIVKQSNGSKHERKDCGCKDKGREYDKSKDRKHDCRCQDKGREYDKSKDRKHDCRCHDEKKSGHGGSGSNSVHQGDNYANGGDGGIAEGGDGGNAYSGNVQFLNGNAIAVDHGLRSLMIPCGCQPRGHDGGAEGGDTYAWSGDARGGDGGDASADGGDGGNAFNVAFVEQSNGSRPRW
jgi:hypothetical protein